MEIPINRHDLIVGVFVMCGIIAIAILLIFLAGPDLLDFGSIKAKTYLPKTYGLKRGVPVTYLDMKAGHVVSVELSGREKKGEQIEVSFTISKKFKDQITTTFWTTLKKEQFGGFLSGEIILNHPEGSTQKGSPVKDGDEIKYMESSGPLDELADFPSLMKRKLIPEFEKLLSGINGFLDQVNNPDGDFRRFMSSLRKTSEHLAKQDGELMRAIAKANKLITEMADEKNLIMSVLHDKTVHSELQETIKNLRAASQKGNALMEKAEKIAVSAGEASLTARDLLADSGPRASEILDRTLDLQQQMSAFLDDARLISANLYEASASIPGLLDDARMQLSEIEEIARAIKKNFIVQWNLDKKPAEDPVLLRPLLLDDFDKPAGQSTETKKE